MPKQILFIHGAGGYEEDEKLVESLRDELGAAYNVRYPKMPGGDATAYDPWKNQLAEELAKFDGEVVIAGHSLGASVALQYLSEEESITEITGVFLLAPPYWGVEDWDVDEFKRPSDFAAKLPENTPMFFYYTRDDETVPLSHLAMYQEKLPQASYREFATGGHQFTDDIPEIAKDIRDT